jgi:hypothetical protein
MNACADAARKGLRVFFAIAVLAVGLTYAEVLDLSWVHDNFLVRLRLLRMRMRSRDALAFAVAAAACWCADAPARQALLTAGNVFAAALSLYLYASSFASGGKRGGKRTAGKQLAAGGNTGNRLYDFFIGRELNPRCANARGALTTTSDWFLIFLLFSLFAFRSLGSALWT